MKLQKLFLHLKAIKVVLRLNRISQSGRIQNIKKANKFYQLYIYHKQKQNVQYKENLRYIQDKKQKLDEKDWLNKFYENYKQKLVKKGQQSKKKLEEKDSSEYEREVRGIFHKGMEYLSLYYESLQNLIEGRRQVVHNKQHKFEDNETVEEKRVKFERFLSRLVGRKKEEVENIEFEEYTKEKYKRNQNKKAEQ